jgi:hypothetical protein
MAKRLVLLSMEQQDAENFVQSMCDPELENGTVQLAVGPATVEWVIAQPTLPCTCHIAEERKRGRRGSRVDRSSFTKTRHLGWWVHVPCKKVSRLVIERFTALLTNGHYDLLPEILGVDAEPNDMRRFHDWDASMRSKR